jgi:transketolase
MLDLTDKKVLAIEEKANTIREDIIKMLLAAGSGHSAGPLDMADIFAAFYFHILNHDPKQPELPDRDRLILSAGHICPVRYAAMANAGYFPRKELLTLRKFGSRLQGHPERMHLPGLETTSGPLGEGIAQAAGMAYAARMDGKSWRTYCVMGDGEQDCGIVWETLLFAGAYKLSNLTVIIDRNNIQIDGPTEKVQPLESLKAKYESFNWRVIEVGGHNIRQFVEAVEEAKATEDRPTCIIAHTIAGKGVDFMEYKFEWHGITPDAEQAEKALNELRTLGGKIISENQ